MHYRRPDRRQFNVTGNHSYADNSPHTTAVTVTHGAAHGNGQPLVVKSVEPGQTINLLGNFGLVEDIYVIGSGTVTVPSAAGALTNDSALGPLSVGTTSANRGSFVFHADGSFMYKAPNNFPGYDYATYTASDAAGDHGTATVYVLSQTGGAVWKFYEQVLGRDPDYLPATQGGGGLGYWISQLDAGATFDKVAQGFFESAEHIEPIIENWYQQFLLRAADPSGLSYWAGIWATDGGPEAVEAGMIDSPEFYRSAGQAHPTLSPNAAWVTTLYERLLNREPDSQGLGYWTNLLDTQQMTEYQVALGFLTSKEDFIDDITGWTEQYLERQPTADEVATYLSQMQADIAAMQAGTITEFPDRQIQFEIINTAEYRGNPPASADGTGVRLPDYRPQSAAASSPAVAARDALFADFGG